ncbi:MAG: signal peptide peptidase SppA [Verrucomicrobiae bacterium]|nr:signal peptide peptidase SppA [Verrucomicrobiae bacterium]
MSQSSSKQGCLIVFLILLLGISAILNGIFYVGLKAKRSSSASRMFVHREFEEKTMVEGRSPNKIVVIDLMGVITYAEPGESGESKVEEIIRQLKQAREDRSVKAIILRINSPGGEVNASDVLYHELQRTRDEFKKPIITYMMSVAASGGYYAAMGTSYLLANEMTITGSVGVIMQSLQYRQLLDKVGLQVLTFKSGKFKDMLSGSREPTPEELQYVQDFIMETYDRFVSIVAKERKLDVEKLKTGVADGRILSGPMALKEKFVDQLGYFEDAVIKAKQLANVREARVVRYMTPFDWRRVFNFFGSASSTKVELNWSLDRYALEPGKAYYLSPHWLAN